MGFFVLRPGSRFTPIANAVRTANPVYMYDPALCQFFYGGMGQNLTVWVQFVLTNFRLRMGLV
jgi:hypothetical protein